MTGLGIIFAILLGFLWNTWEPSARDAAWGGALILTLLAATLGFGIAGAL
jgi:hypothetical protein